MLRRSVLVGEIRPNSLNAVLHSQWRGGRSSSVECLSALSTQHRAIAFQSTTPLYLKRTRTRKGRPSGVLLSAMLGISPVRKEGATNLAIQQGRVGTGLPKQRQPRQRSRKEAPALRRDALTAKLTGGRRNKKPMTTAPTTRRKSASKSGAMSVSSVREQQKPMRRNTGSKGAAAYDGNHCDEDLDDHNAAPPSSLEISYANAAQILGILRAAYDAPHPSAQHARLLRGNHDSLPKPTRNDDDDDDNSADEIDATKALRVRRLVRVEVPPVEVPVSGSMTSAFVPRELLRRVLREESGSSIAARAVTLNCVIKRAPTASATAPKSASAPGIRGSHMSTQASQRSAHRQTPGEPKQPPTASPSKRSAAPGKPSSASLSPAASRNANSTSAPPPSPLPVTAQDLDDAALVGDAALIAQERHVADSEQLRLAIADERPNTKLQEPPDAPETSSGGVLLQPQHATAVADVPPHVVSLTADRKQSGTISTASSASTTTTTKAHESQSESPHPTIAGNASSTCSTMHAAENKEKFAADSEQSDGDEEADEDDAAGGDNNVSNPRQLSGEDLQTLAPFQNGTVIPLSTNYVTRSERVDEPFHPFSPRLDAKSIPLLSSASLPPIEGIATSGTIVAVKVSHNRRDTLELAADLFETAQDIHHAERRTKKNAVFARGAATVAAKQIVLERHVPNVEPHIEVFILNDDESFDFGNILFDVAA